MPRKKNRSHGMKIFVFILLAILLWLLVFSKYNIIKIIKSDISLSKKKSKINKLQSQKEKLAKEKHLLDINDPKIMEKKARELGMIKKGEKIIRIDKTESKPSSKNE